MPPASEGRVDIGCGITGPNISVNATCDSVSACVCVCVCWYCFSRCRADRVDSSVGGYVCGHARSYYAWCTQLQNAYVRSSTIVTHACTQCATAPLGHMHSRVLQVLRSLGHETATPCAQQTQLQCLTLRPHLAEHVAVQHREPRLRSRTSSERVAACVRYRAEG